MNKEDYIRVAKRRMIGKKRRIIINQINTFFEVSKQNIKKCSYEIGEDVYLKQGTLIHGTYKNIEGLKEIVQNGLISSWFIDGRGSKYPSSVGVWNLKNDFLLKDYINFYSGGTIRYFNQKDKDQKTEVVPYDKMTNVIHRIENSGYLAWGMEQTKEARFLPSLVQNKSQIGIIFNSNNSGIRKLLKSDILNCDNFNNVEVKPFVNKDYYKTFIKDRKNKDDFFTDRESAILFGIPSNLIEGILVGREYEKDKSTVMEIKNLLPDCYICNLDGKVIY